MEENSIVHLPIQNTTNHSDFTQCQTHTQTHKHPTQKLVRNRTLIQTQHYLIYFKKKKSNTQPSIILNPSHTHMPQETTQLNTTPNIATNIPQNYKINQRHKLINT